MHVLKASREKIAFARSMKREQTQVAFAGVPCPRKTRLFAIHEQIHLARESRERGHRDAAVAILDDQLGYEDRVREIGERVLEALTRMHPAERVEIAVDVFADEHGT